MVRVIYFSIYYPFPTLRQVEDGVINRIFLNVAYAAQEFWLHMLVPLIQIYSILYTVSNSDALPHSNSINTHVGSLILNLKEQSHVIRGGEEVGKCFKKRNPRFILANNLYFYQYSLNILYGYFTTVLNVPSNCLLEIYFLLYFKFIILLSV